MVRARSIQQELHRKHQPLPVLRAMQRNITEPMKKMPYLANSLQHGTRTGQ